MMIITENTKSKRNELNGFNVMVDNTDCQKIIAFRFGQEMTGTEKQKDYARSILSNKVFKINDIAALEMSNGKMNDNRYYEGMTKLIEDLGNLTDAKYIIEHVK